MRRPGEDRNHSQDRSELLGYLSGVPCLTSVSRNKTPQSYDDRHDKGIAEDFSGPPADTQHSESGDSNFKRNPLLPLAVLWLFVASTSWADSACFRVPPGLLTETTSSPFGT